MRTLVFCVLGDTQARYHWGWGQQMKMLVVCPLFSETLSVSKLTTGLNCTDQMRRTEDLKLPTQLVFSL